MMVRRPPAFANQGFCAQSRGPPDTVLQGPEAVREWSPFLFLDSVYYYCRIYDRSAPCRPQTTDLAPSCLEWPF